MESYCFSCNTKSEVLSFLSNDPFFYKNIREKTKKKYWKDIANDILLKLLERDNEELILNLNKKNELFNYINKILWLETRKNNKKGTMFNKYESFQSYLCEHNQIENITEDNEIDKEYMFIQIKKALSKVHWYDRKIFFIYFFSKKTYRELEQELDISRQSICRTVNKVINKLRTELNGHI